MARDRKKVFEILVREHDLALLAFVRSCIHDQIAAEDLVQDSFLAAWTQLDQYNKDTPFARWLRGIARNKILAYFRSSSVATGHVKLLDPQQIATIAGEFDRLIPRRGDAFGDTLTALRECLSLLPDANRHVIHLTYHERQGCRAIADRIGQTLEAVKKRLQRARAQLRDCITRKLKEEPAHA